MTAGCTNLILVPICRGRRSPRVSCTKAMWTIRGRPPDSTAVVVQRSADFCGRGLPRGAGGRARAIGVARGGAARSGRGGRGADAGGARAPGGPEGRGGGAGIDKHPISVRELTHIGARFRGVDRRTGPPRAARRGRGPLHGASSGREAGPWTGSPGLLGRRGGPVDRLTGPPRAARRGRGPAHRGSPAPATGPWARSRGLLGPRGGPIDRRTGPPQPPTRSRGAPHPPTSTPGPPPRAPPRPACRGLSRAGPRQPPRRRTWGCGCRRRRAPPPGRGGRGPRAGPRRRRGR
jgi:hypothetical protein